MILGLTGGIGSGKSMVARVFETLGCALFNSDVVAKEVYYKTEVKSKVIALLGNEAYTSDSELNKPFISKKIFSDTTTLHKLNDIIHPAVKNEFVEFVEKNKGRIIVKETALLFEAGLTGQVDKIITVVANDELRIKRVMLRDNLSREEVLSKIKSQLLQEEKMKLSHFVITNDETEFIAPQVLKIMNQVKNHV